MQGIILISSWTLLSTWEHSLSTFREIYIICVFFSAFLFIKLSMLIPMKIKLLREIKKAFFKILR